MTKVKYFRVEEHGVNGIEDSFEIISRLGYFSFWSDDDRIAFEEKIEEAFRQCMGSGLEVTAVGKN